MPSHLRRNAIAYVAVFLALGGTSYAAVSKFTARGGTIKACVTKRSGDVRLVKPSVRKCRRGQTLVRWNEKGRPGAAGAPGLQGAPGPRGEQGAAGPAGSVNTSRHYTKDESDARYLGKGATAADAEALGGVPASGYVRGSGTYRSASVGPVTPPMAPPTELATTVLQAGDLRVQLVCDPNDTDQLDPASYLMLTGATGTVYRDDNGVVTTQTGPAIGSARANAGTARRVSFRGAGFDITVFHSATGNLSCSADAAGVMPG